MDIRDAYLEQYHKVGRKVERYETFVELYEHYMSI